MSTTKVIDSKTKVRDFLQKSTVLIPKTKDNDFTWKDFQIRNNSELVAIYGNFTNRVLSLINKYYHGKIPNPNSKNNTDELVLNEVKSLKSKIELSLNEFKFRLQ